MADKNTKYKDLKKGDHLYSININSKTYEPIFCEYELVDDMIFTGPQLYQYECHIMPVNENAKNSGWFGPHWDGKPVRWWPGLSWNDNGEDKYMTTCLEYVKEYYKKYIFNSNHLLKLEEEIRKTKKKLDQLNKIYKYHKKQYNNFDFYNKDCK